MKMLVKKRLKSLLIYNSTTGQFFWKNRKLRKGLERIDNSWNVAHAGKEVLGCVRKGKDTSISLYCRCYSAHRIAWIMYYGTNPIGDIDHINGNPHDNRICNLRVVTPSQNLMNSKLHFDSTSGVKGVSKDKRSGRWHVYVTVNYKRIFSKLFDSFEDAVKARKEAEQKYHGEFARSA